jgi:chitinase
MYKTLAVAAFAAAPALATGKLNAYWGQTKSIRLREYCDLDTFEYVTVGFVNNSPEFDTSGLKYPGTNFGANCAADVYENGGQKSKLLSNCNLISADIPYCQSKGKKVLLSIGGAPGEGTHYNVTTDANGEYFAQFLWEAFGPKNPSSSTPRPFDVTGQPPVVVDGFDFDIEEYFEDNKNGYPAMVDKLHELINGGDFLVTAAPECPLNPQFFKMKKIIDQSKFDALFIQFYNNAGCDGKNGGFNFEEWVNYLKDGPSKNALLYVGLPGSPESANTGYLDFEEATALVESVKDHPKFGGVMVWDMYTSNNNKKGCATFQRALHDALCGTDTTPETCEPVTPGPTVCIEEYTVKSGDTCYDIAFAHNLSLDEFLALNPGENCALNVGDVLCLARGPAPSSSAPAIPSSSAPASSSAIPSSSAIVSSSAVVSSSAIVSSSAVVSSSAYPSSSVSSAGPISSAPSAAPSSVPSSAYSSATSSDEEYCEEEPSTESSVVPSSSAPSSAVPSSSVPASVPAVPSSSASSAVSSNAPVSSAPSSSVPSSVASSDYSSATSSDDYCYEESSTESSVVPSSAAPSSVVPSSSVPASVSASASVAPSSSAPVSSAVSSNGPISSASPSVSIPIEYTTSTIYTTICETLTSCTPGTPDCGTQVVTRTIAVSTTVCPVTTTPSATAWPTGWTTSTVYSTKTYTITSCAPTVTDCPGKIGQVTTEIIPVSTTICPITQGWPKPTGIIVPTWQPDQTVKTSVTDTQFTTVTVPNPGKPSGVKPVGETPALPIKDVSETKPVGGPAGVAKPSASGWGGSKPGSTSVPVTAGAGRNSAALGLSALAAVLFFAL